MDEKKKTATNNGSRYLMDILIQSITDVSVISFGNNNPITNRVKRRRIKIYFCNTYTYWAFRTSPLVQTRTDIYADINQYTFQKRGTFFCVVVFVKCVNNNE